MPEPRDAKCREKERRMSTLGMEGESMYPEEAIRASERSARGAKKEPCPWCSAEPRQRHDEWCPCSRESRSFIKQQYAISDAAGLAAADRIYAAAETISGGGRV